MRTLPLHTSRGDYATALRLLRPLADQGDAVAQFYLGLMYDNGRGVPQNYAEAVKWYRLAADQGNANAQFNLGVMYANGRGCRRTTPRRVKWFRLAADQGDANAQFNLGVMYANGRGRAAELRRGAEVVSPRRRPGRRQRAVQSRRHVRTMARGCRRTTPRP